MSINLDPQAIALLRENETFAGFTDAEISEMLTISERQSYQKDEKVFSFHQKGSFFYVIESGTFLLSLRSKRYKSLQRGDLFGEIAVINENLRTGSIRALEPATVLAFSGEKLYSGGSLSDSTTLKLTRVLARNVTNYLRSREQISTVELIAAGESEFVEFKSSLRWNPEKQNKDRLYERAVIRSIAAFMNAQGGVLLIGVRDDKEVVGIGQDRFENFDKMLLHLTHLVKRHISTLHTEFLRFEIEPIGEKHVLRVDCEAATSPAYVREGSEESFFVRTGPASSRMKVSKIYDYIRMRFH